MHATVSRAAPRPTTLLSPALLAGLFWVFTYAVLLLRAELVSVNDVLLLSERRFLATTVGAFLYWLILKRIDADARLSQRRPLSTLALVLPASIVVMAVRMLFDQFVPARAIPLLSHLHWILFWMGYFGTWVSISLASRVQAEQRIVVAEQKNEAMAWIVDRLADELMTSPRANRAELIDRLRADAGYAQADDQFDASAVRRKARLELIEQIAARAGRR